MELKKGPWTPEEGQKLISYIERYGIWNWQQMPRAAGLLRSGKSCRLRWMNYLRPDLKRGKYSVVTIIRLHKILGNRWSLLAGRLPGRTDNEIKNYWHTHLRKKIGNNDSKTSVGCSNTQNSISCIQESCASNHISGFSAQSCFFKYGSSSSSFSGSIDTQHSFNMLHEDGRLVRSEELGSSDDKLNEEEAALMPEGPCTISESTDIIESDASDSVYKNSKPEDSSNSSTSSGSDDDDMAGFHSTFLFGPKLDE